MGIAAGPWNQEKKRQLMQKSHTNPLRRQPEAVPAAATIAGNAVTELGMENPAREKQRTSGDKGFHSHSKLKGKDFKPWK